MNFNPARRARHILSVVFRAPAFHEAHSNGTHFCEFIDGLEAVIHTLTEELGKFLIVKDLKAASGWDFADCGGMKTVMKVAVTTLYKYGTVTETFGKYFTTDIVQMYACKYKM